MKRQSYYNAKQSSQDYQYSDGEDQHFSQRNQSYEKRSRHTNGGAPYSMSDNEGSRYQRYDSHQSSIMNTSQDRVGKIAIFYKDNDSLFQGIPMAVSRKRFPEFHSLILELNNKITLPNGVRFVFRREDAKRVESVDDIQGGEEYVVSSKKKFNRNTKYGACHSKPGSHMQRSQGPSREYNLQNRQRVNPPPLNGSPSQPHQSQNNKPLRFRIINNTYRSVSDRMIVNPNTEESFEQLLANMGEVVSIVDGPPTAMFLAKQPYNEITSFSSLKQELASHNKAMFGSEIPKGIDEPLCEFFICDSKGPPKEVLQRPMRGNQSNLGEDSYNDDPYGTSNDESYGRQAPEGHQPRNQKPRQQQQRTNGHVNGYQESPRRADDSKKFSRAPPSNRERDQDANKRYTSPPRNNNRQTDQRNARQNERGLNKPTRNNAQQRSPDRQTRFRKENGERPHQQQQNHIGNGASSRRDSDYQDHSPTETRRRQERSPPETHRRQTESPPGNNRRQERSPPRDRRERDQHTDDSMDGHHINDRRVSRDDDDMDHDGNEDDDEYDDDSDGPGEPRAARKGPRIETPEF